MRVSVTITDEMNEYFKSLAEQRGVSKDKIIGEILSKSIAPAHNVRGAGRKAKFSDIEIYEMKDYKDQGYTYGQISEIFKCSVGLVHKLINE